MKRLLAFAPLSLIVAAVVVYVSVIRAKSEPETTFAPPPLMPSAALEGMRFPDIVAAPLGPDRAGWSTDDLLADAGEGRAVVVNVWGSWCPPCRAEMPLLSALADEGVAIYGIAWRDDPADAAAFLAEAGDPFTAVGYDADGGAQDVLQMWGAPETFVVGPDGVVRLHVNSPIDAAFVERRLRPALAAD